MSLARHDVDEQAFGGPRIKRATLYDQRKLSSPWGVRRKPELPDEAGAEVVVLTGKDPEGRETRIGYWPTSDRDVLEPRGLPPVEVP